jgi:hypothetical protein
MTFLPKIGHSPSAAALVEVSFLRLNFVVKTIALTVYAFLSFRALCNSCLGALVICRFVVIAFFAAITTAARCT